MKSKVFKNMIIRRIVGFLIDYILIGLYASILFTISLWLKVGSFSPIWGQLIGFFTLTLPVILYFYFCEIGKFNATLGKRSMKIKVINSHSSEKGNIILRNILKFLPWEIAHLGVHWIVYFSNNGEVTPIWVYLVLVIPQIIILAYFFSIVYYKGESSIYDKIAGTRLKYIRAK